MRPLLIGSFPWKTLTYAVYDLCLHPEYVEPLREEIEGPKYIEFSKTAKGLPLLDSFIKESVRLTPTEASKSLRHTIKSGHPMIHELSPFFKVTTRCMALKPFVFTDGTRLERGDWACILLRAILHDSQLYPDPMAFHGFRFAEEEKKAEPFSFSQPEGSSKLSDVSNKWHVWW